MTFIDFVLFWIAGVLVISLIAGLMFTLGYLFEMVKNKIADDEFREELERRNQGTGTRYTGTN